jgi:hypothetical protein
MEHWSLNNLSCSSGLVSSLVWIWHPYFEMDTSQSMKPDNIAVLTHKSACFVALAEGRTVYLVPAEPLPCTLSSPSPGTSLVVIACYGTVQPLLFPAITINCNCNEPYIATLHSAQPNTIRMKSSQPKVGIKQREQATHLLCNVVSAIEVPLTTASECMLKPCNLTLHLPNPVIKC